MPAQSNLSSISKTPAKGQRSQPLKTSFVLTSMPVGGAEMLLVNLIDRLDRRVIDPEVVCLKEPGPLGLELRHKIPVHSNMIRGKWDVRVLWKLYRRFRRSRTDAVVNHRGWRQNVLGTAGSAHGPRAGDLQRLAFDGLARWSRQTQS